MEMKLPFYCFLLVSGVPQEHIDDYIESYTNNNFAFYNKFYDKQQDLARQNEILEKCLQTMPVSTRLWASELKF